MSMFNKTCSVCRLYEVPVCDLISEAEVSVLCQSLPDTGIENWEQDSDVINF